MWHSFLGMWHWLLGQLKKLFGGSGGRQTQIGGLLNQNNSTVVNAGRDVHFIQATAEPSSHEDYLSDLTVAGAEMSLAVLILAPSSGAKKLKETIFHELQKEGFPRTVLERALLNLRSRDHVRVEDHREVLDRGSIVNQAPPGVYLTNEPKPEPDVLHLDNLVPQPGLKEWLDQSQK